MSDCGCGQDKVVFVDETPWLRVSVDLLQMFERPILCRLRYKIFDTVLTQVRLEEIRVLISDYIAAKIADPTTQLYFDRFPEIQAVIDDIYNKGVCL